LKDTLLNTRNDGSEQWQRNIQGMKEVMQESQEFAMRYF
jgi:hypothetical protein